MSIKSKVFAAAATLTLIGGVGAAGATSASAATPSCGSTCIEIFNHDFGTHAHPNFVLDTLRQGEKVGQPQILFRVANSDPAEDYTISYQGLVSDFLAAALVSAAVTLHYGDGAVGCSERRRVRDPVLALRRGQRPVHGCRHHGRGRHQGLAAAVWRLRQDRVDRRLRGHGPPRLRSADQRLGHQLLPPVRADLPVGFGYPTDKPRPQLYVTNLTGSQGAGGVPLPGTINSNQLFGADFGILAP